MMISNTYIKHNNNKIKLDFLGKDSIRYVNKFKVPDIVYNNIKEFHDSSQKKSDDLFDLITSESLNKYIKGFTLTHEEENLDELKDNMSKRFNNFINSPKHTTFLWSNAQANFTPDLNSCGTTIKDYFLNKKRYDAICDLTFDLFQSNVKFAVRKEYVEDKMLLDLPNVYIVDIPFGTFNLFGTDYNTFDGSPIRDYVHVMEICHAIREAIEKPANGLENLGHGVGHTVKEMITKYQEVNNCKFDVVPCQRREGDLEYSVLDNVSTYMKELYSFDELMKVR